MYTWNFVCFNALKCIKWYMIVMCHELIVFLSFFFTRFFSWTRVFSISMKSMKGFLITICRRSIFLWLFSMIFLDLTKTLLYSLTFSTISAVNIRRNHVFFLPLSVYGTTSFSIACWTLKLCLVDTIAVIRNTHKLNLYVWPRIITIAWMLFAQRNTDVAIVAFQILYSELTPPALRLLTALFSPSKKVATWCLSGACLIFIVEWINPHFINFFSKRNCSVGYLL